MTKLAIEQIGSPRQVYEKPTTRYVMDFLGQVNHLSARIRIANGQAMAIVGASEVALPSREGWDDGDEAVLAFRAEAVALADSGGQVRGTVTAGWAKSHHGKWFREVSGR